MLKPHLFLLLLLFLPPSLPPSLQLVGQGIDERDVVIPWRGGLE
jgi:hypothetical protein